MTTARRRSETLAVGVPWLVSLVALGCAVGLIGNPSLARSGPSGLQWALAAALCSVAELVAVRVGLGRGTWESTLLPVSLVMILVWLGPWPAIVVATASTIVAQAVRSRSLRDVGRRTAMTLGPIAGGASCFAVLGHPGPIVLTNSVAGVAAGLGFCVITWTVTAARAYRSGSLTRRPSLPLAVGAALVCSSTALTVVELERLGPFLPALVAPMVVAMVLGVRHLASQQADHDRLDRLAGASARTTGLRSFEAAVAQAAGEAGPLVGGSVALSVAMGEDDAIVGSVVDAAGVRPAAAEILADLVKWIGPNGGERAVHGLPASVMDLCPGALTVVTAGTLENAQPGTLAVVVLRRQGNDGDGPARSDLLKAFVDHAGLIATNALLFGRVEAALRDQVDMNRQKDEFLAAVSHELRTPLASMLGSVETLRRLDGRMTDDARERFFSIAHRQGKRLQRLIEELLLTASLDHRQEVVAATSCELPEIFEEVAVDLADQSQGRIRVRVDPGANTICSDPHKLRQVVTNLVENATKYAPEGLIELSAGPRGSRIEIRVSDHGPGIAAEDRERAFGRFVQLDGSSTRAQGGTGLGLYLCRRVADLLEGDLSLSETPGGGSTFVVSLPRSHSTGRPGEPGATDAPAARVAAGARPGTGPGALLDRSLLDLRRGPSSGPAAGLGARPVVPAGLVTPREPHSD